jgi:methylated-DNA-protein-cysteine methyltransferase related protein
MPRRSDPKPVPAKEVPAKRAFAKPAAAKPRLTRAGSAKPGSIKTRTAKETIKRIHTAIRAIPAGSVAGYGVVARRAGLPGRARLVARILSNNDDASLPWHRVLRSDGRIAFPPDSEGYGEQVQRLRAEGVAVENGRVHDLRRSESDLDTLLWAPPRK